MSKTRRVVQFLKLDQWPPSVDRDRRWLLGVCSGFARLYGVSPSWFRAALILLFFAGGVVALPYFVAWALMERDPDQWA